MYNETAIQSSNGQMDMFTGDVLSKEDILRNILKQQNYDTRTIQITKTNDVRDSSKTESINGRQSTDERGRSTENSNTTDVRRGTEKETEIDNQGNPINKNGKLVIEKINSIDDLTDEDFNNPKRNVELPKLPEYVDKAIGGNKKPVIIKKNIFKKNRDKHNDLTPQQSKEIISNALYIPNLIGKTQPSLRPKYWIAIKTNNKNSIIIIEVNNNKDNLEIISWYNVDNKGLEKIKRQAEREDGQLLVQTSNTLEAAAALSTLTHDLSSEYKDTTNLKNDKEKQEKSLKNNSNQGFKEDKDGNITDEAKTDILNERNEINAQALKDGNILLDDKGEYYCLAPNGKRSNLTVEQWITTRTKRFKEWFGDWELAGKIIKKVRAEKEHGFKNFNEARKWAKKNIVGVLSNEQTENKGEIRISSTAIDKFISESSVVKSENKDVHLSVLKVLPNVIRESINVEQHPDYLKDEYGIRSPKNGINNDVNIHRLYGIADIDGKDYRIKITVKENVATKETPNVYTYEVTKIELLDGQSRDVYSTSHRNSNNSITGAKLLQNVEKSNKKGEKLLDVSKIVDENGEPLVVYHGTSSDDKEMFYTFNIYNEGVFTTKKKNSVPDNTTDTVETQKGNENDTATPENAVSNSKDTKVSENDKGKQEK